MTSPATHLTDQEAQILRRRAMRRRRQRYWIPVDVVAATAFLVSGIWLRDNTPLHALIILGYASVSAAGPLLLQGTDAWQRHGRCSALLSVPQSPSCG